MSETFEALLKPIGTLFLVIVSLGVLKVMVKLLIALLTTQDDFPYVLQKTLFTAAERSFLGVLEQALDDDHRVFGKVRVADVLKVKSGLARKAWQAAFNRISAKHIDFVVCRKDDLSVAYLVELDDKSHLKRKRAARDKFLVSATEAAGVRLVRVTAQKSYSVEALREVIRGEG